VRLLFHWLKHQNGTGNILLSAYVVAPWTARLHLTAAACMDIDNTFYCAANVLLYQQARSG
jgi:hypothetical protein